MVILIHMNLSNQVNSHVFNSAAGVVQDQQDSKFKTHQSVAEFPDTVAICGGQRGWNAKYSRKDEREYPKTKGAIPGGHEKT